MNSMTSALRLGACTLFAVGVSAGVVSAQDFTLDANYGEIDLAAGFTPDPHTVAVRSGGTVDASGVGNGCRGMVSNAPDYQLNYDAGSLPLYFTTRSSADLTLVVNGPDGRWYCDDDGGEGLNPLLRFDSPMSGAYDIWVGTYGGEDYLDARLVITELQSETSGDSVAPSGSSSTNSGGAPIYETVRLSAGFTPDPYIVRLSSGGSRDASALGSDCRGYIANSADVNLDYTSGSMPLYISGDSMADTTLVIRAPNGQYYCDDDSGEGTNPSVQFNTPLSGRYQIWVGTYGESEMHSAELNISEIYSE